MQDNFLTDEEGGFEIRDIWLQFVSCKENRGESKNQNARYSFEVCATTIIYRVKINLLKAHVTRKSDGAMD